VYSNVAEFEFAGNARQRAARFQVLRRLVQQLEDAGAGGQALLQRREGIHEPLERRGRHQRGGDETHEIAGRHGSRLDLVQRHPQDAAQSERCDELHHRVADGARRDELHVAPAVVLIDLLEVG
jgi:hypothetical protein